jgi:hypothetical protein
MMGVFAGDEVRLEASFNAARARLANLARGSSLVSASRHAYGEGLTVLVRVGPLGAMPGLSRLVEVRFRDLVTDTSAAVLTLRWEATGPGGGLFPVLDADITLTPGGEQVLEREYVPGFPGRFQSLSGDDRRPWQVGAGHRHGARQVIEPAEPGAVPQSHPRHSSRAGNAAVVADRSAGRQAGTAARRARQALACDTGAGARDVPGTTVPVCYLLADHVGAARSRAW